MIREPSGPWDQPGNWKQEEMTARQRRSAEARPEMETGETRVYTEAAATTLRLAPL